MPSDVDAISRNRSNMASEILAVCKSCVSLAVAYSPALGSMRIFSPDNCLACSATHAMTAFLLLDRMSNAPGTSPAVIARARAGLRKPRSLSLSCRCACNFPPNAARSLRTAARISAEAGAAAGAASAFGGWGASFFSDFLAAGFSVLALRASPLGAVSPLAGTSAPTPLPASGCWRAGTFFALGFGTALGVSLTVTSATLAPFFRPRAPGVLVARGLGGVGATLVLVAAARSAGIVGSPSWVNMGSWVEAWRRPRSSAGIAASVFSISRKRLIALSRMGAVMRLVPLDWYAATIR